MPKCSQCGVKITGTLVKYGGASYCNEYCFASAKQYLKENGIILI